MKALNTGLGILGSRLLGRPFYVRFHVSYRCNYRCRMCALHGRADDFGELSLERVQLVADRLARLGARHVVLTGGEPFLRRDLPDIVAAFAGRGFSVRVQTNGGAQLTERALVAAAAAGLRDVSVSIDTLDRALQDDICGSRGVVENALRSLDLAARHLPRGMSLANIVASRLNFTSLPDLIEFFGSRGVYTYITPVMIRRGEGEEETDYLFRSGDGAFRFDDIAPGQHDAVLDRLIALRRRGSGLTNSSRFLEDFRSFLAGGACSWRCEAGRLCLDVRPDGGVAICKEKPSLGNILDPGFPAFYRSEEFAVRSAEQVGECSGCFYGEYREPQYAVRDLSVLAEWSRDWLRTFRRGMRWRRADNA